MDTLDFPFEIKSVGDAGAIEGLAAAFGNIDSYGDKIVAGAFTKSLAGRAGKPVPMLLHHDVRKPIGSWTEIRETADGLYAKGALSLPARDAIDAHALAKSGAISGLSIGFRVPAGGMSHGMGVRVLSEIDLKEVSLVTFPANDRARVHGVKSITRAQDIAEIFQDMGFSSRRAKAAAGIAWKSLNDSDDDQEAAEQLADIFRKSAARIAAQ